MGSTTFETSGDGGSGGHGASSDPRLACPVFLRGVVLRLVAFQSAADRLPSAPYAIVTNGKIAALAFLGAYVVFVVLWIPFWLLSFVVTEWGVYALAIVTVFFVGRSIIRLIAFPGASQKVANEIETEFARYSVRMLASSCEAFVEVASILASAFPADGESTKRRQQSSDLYDLPIYWSRAKTYRNRVLGVYLEVLLYLYHEPPLPSAQGAPDLTRYGNNRLSGDIGNLSGLTQEARNDGRELTERLKRVLAMIDELEQLAKPVLEAGLAPGASNPLPAAAGTKAKELASSMTELRDYVASLRPTSSSGGSGDDDEDETDEDLTVDTVRRRFEEQSGSAMDTVKSGLASIIPMLDPPPHTSIFGFDVQRGCMLSRYRGSRQLWVRRPRGGMIDVLHFPAPKSLVGRQQQQGGSTSTQQANPRAVLYCNPNAGLIEVTTGMSLVGGNVPGSDLDVTTSRDTSWTDFYTREGIDVFVFNYAGYARSYGTTLCVSGANAGNDYHPGILARLGRIFKSTFLTFTPTPDTLRADGVAVAQHLINDIGVNELVIHGESIGGVAASGTGRYLSHLPATSKKISLLVCDRTFCNLEAVAQRLVGGWSGYAIRALAPFWSTDVTGDFLAASCPKVIATDAADAIIADAASLKSGVALWKEIRRGVSTTKDIGWIVEMPLQYRMADWENVCVTDSKYVSGKSLLRVQAPVWPADKHVSVEEAFHFAACLTRIGKLARVSRLLAAQNYDEEGGGFEYNDRTGAISTQGPLILEAWKDVACCDGLTGNPLGIAVKRGFDSTVSWLCSCLVFGGQALVAAAEARRNRENSLGSGPLEIVPADFDFRPPGYQEDENDEIVHPKPIPEVVDKLVFFLQTGEESISKRKLHPLEILLSSMSCSVSPSALPNTHYLRPTI